MPVAEGTKNIYELEVKLRDEAQLLRRCVAKLLARQSAVK
jgi:hypothetical protein